jgi:hypothetical protein
LGYRRMARDDAGAGIDWESLSEATSGAVGSLVSTTVLYPLDTCKSKFQAELQTQQGSHKYRCGSSSPFLPLAGWIQGDGEEGLLYRQEGIPQISDPRILCFYSRSTGIL